jgi:hypothetical protein
MTPLAIYILCVLGGVVAGGGGVLLFQPKDKAPEVVAATATVVDSAVREDVTDADTRQAIATMPAVNIAVEAAVQPQATPETYALAAYALCLSAAQGKAEGSSAFGCVARGQTLDGLLAEP